ncbi:MAG: DEAD/DEAH box helicase [Alphaproteobacteria bacterium]|nr:DEAD/DEAH box helicase [Alphaproteobacteria bacterium]
MGRLQATWCATETSGELFFWSAEGPVDAAVADELPELRDHVDEAQIRPIVVRGPPLRRRKTEGYVAPLDRVLPLLTALRNDPTLADSVRAWSVAALFGLELAARQAVVPSVGEGTARWRALVHRRDDRARLQSLAEALPVSARLTPTRDHGPVRIPTGDVAVRGFLDAIVDCLYRTGTWPGPARGWVLELGDALRGTDPAFRPRDARSQGIPAKLAAWSAGDGAVGLRLGMTLSLPPDTDGRFRLGFWMHPSDDPGQRVPLDDAWQAGESLQLGERTHAHPAFSALRGLARGKRIFPPLAAALSGRVPSGLTWGPTDAWRFLAEGLQPLLDAGFEVEVPEAFSDAGTQRMRARLRVEAQPDGLNLGELLTYRWEVVVGDLVLSGEEFAELLASGQPIVRFRGSWVLIDPAEVEKLPEGLPREGTLDAAEALRAVLTGQHEGVPVVADAGLDLLLDALRSPPERPVPEALQATLRPYQKVGLSWLACLGDLGLGACLADDMGLGKTVQLIAHVVDRRARGADKPCLVVCPTSVLGNWIRELGRFAPHLTVSRHHGLDRDLAQATRADVVLTTYGLLARDVDALSEVAWDVVALDEAQAIKNPDSRRAQAASRLDARHRVAMSGTPVENRLEELWSLMRFLIPGLLGTRAHFHRTVAIPVERFGDEEVAWRLKAGVSPFLLRRVKTDPDVASDLPDKVERHEFCALTAEQAALYRDVSEEHLVRIAEAQISERRGHVLAMLTALKQICNHPAHYLKEEGPLEGRSGKLERATELLEQVLELGDRAIVFTQYREMGDRLKRHLGEAFEVEVPFLHGGVASHARDEMVRRFQEDDDVPLLLVSLRAGGTGLNLTRATHVLHYDRWWNPAVEDQATDRAYRIGQHRNVQVHKFVCQGTLEERIDALLDEKRSLAESVVGNGERLVADLDDAALRALVSLGDDALVEESAA